MVYFVCESCNETLKKAQVDRHLYSCKNCWGVTCVDCNFTFEGDTFRAHTSCVSEDQKYQGALFKAPKAKQKNRGVNEIWTDAVLRAATNASKGAAPKPLCAHLVRMGDLGNVPRQEKKFKNFIKNSMRVFDDANVAKLWDYLDGIKNDITREEKKDEAPPAVAVVAAPPSAEERSAERSSVDEKSAGGKDTKKSAEKSKKKGKKRTREESKVADDAIAAEDSTTTTTAKSNGSKRKKKKNKGEQDEVTNGDGEALTAVEAPEKEANGGEGERGVHGGTGRVGGVVVDAAARKALAKAAIEIIKKAPKNKLPVKELVKQAAAAVTVTVTAGGLDDKELRRALKQRLKKEGLRRVTVENGVASYSSCSSSS